MQCLLSLQLRIPFLSDETLEEWVTGSGLGILASNGIEVGLNLLVSAWAKVAAFHAEGVKSEHCTTLHCQEGASRATTL